MPVKIPNGLPAIEILSNENIFVMDATRADTQDIRPLSIAILNLMPTKKTTETQLMRLLGNTPLQVNISLLRTASYESRNTDREYLDTFYRTFEEASGSQFDGLVVTGAPVEQMPFEEVAYWRELVEVIEWAEKNVFSTFYICWAAQAALYHFHGIDKRPLDKKLFGVFEHRPLSVRHRLLRGFDDVFWAPHSRHTEVKLSDVEKAPDIEVLAVSERAGFYLGASRDGRSVFATGHSEYDPRTLEGEYLRDIDAGLEIEPPENYYPENDPSRPPTVSWRSHGNLLFGNWLNYFVYQETPFIVERIRELR
ncbi:MAG: homoserine O-succinyltransferase [Oscillospiraceae bacterium]|nr:homoserine O-succinyltransferase [Oscillospiraceae bacterium]